MTELLDQAPKVLFDGSALIVSNKYRFVPIFDTSGQDSESLQRRIEFRGLRVVVLPPRRRQKVKRQFAIH